MTEIKMGLTIEEAAECTGIGRNTMRKLVDWGKLPVLKVGRKTIIRRDTLERFMTVNQGRISLIQAMYEKWNNRSPKPSAFESEIHPSHKSAICTLGISPLRGACITTSDTITSVMIQRKLHRNFHCCPTNHR